MESAGPLPLDLPRIRREARLRSHENEAFRLHIRQYKTAVFDPLVHRIAAEVSARIDCTQCGNCCRELHPAVQQEEVPRLAACKGMSPQAFEAAHLTLAESGEYHLLHQPPCLFLEGNRCSIYAQRPESCAGFPHLDVPDQKFRFRRLLDQYGRCPIVYYTVEGLKIALEFDPAKTNQADL